MLSVSPVVKIFLYGQAADLPLDGQAASLVVVEEDPLLAKLLLQHLILGPQVFDDLLLLLIHSAS